MRIELVDSLDSTNSELMRRAQNGDVSAVCLVAKTQTAARGRMGRRWLSQHDALTFSLGLVYQPQDWAGLSLAVGVTLAEQLHPDIRIKWPNDMLLDERKLAGILIETCAIQGGKPSQRYVVIGVGLNLDAPQPTSETGTDAHAGLARPAAGLRSRWPACQAPQVLDRVLGALQAGLMAFAQAGFAPWRSRFAKRDALLGQSVSLSNGVTGVAQGVTAKGELMVQTALGVQTVVSGEVSTRSL